METLFDDTWVSPAFIMNETTTDKYQRIILTFFLVNLEVTIVSTSLVAITNDLHGFSETSWVVSGYLVTYMGGYYAVFTEVIR